MFEKISLRVFPFLIAIVFLFPVLKENISTITIGLLLLNTIIYRISIRSFFFSKDKMLLTIPFWIILISSFFSNDFLKSLSHINHSLLFLIIPILFAYLPINLFSEKSMLFYIGVLKKVCLVIAIMYVLFYFIDTPAWRFRINFYNESTFRNYVYKDFKWFKIHPTYYTTILILCVTHSLNLVLEKKKYFQLVYVIAFSAITFLLLTKLTIVLMVSLVIFMVLFKNSLHFAYKGLLFTFSILSVFLLIQYTPGIKNRFMETYNSFNIKPKDLAFDSTNIRKAIFDCSATLAKENWVFGTGFENLQKELNNCYQSNYTSDFYKNHNYLTHNYYLYILISSGIIGFICYLIYLANIIKIAYQSNLFIFKTFVFTILIVCFIEDFFYRQYGVLYFNLITMCFIKYIEYKKNNPKNDEGF